MTQLAETYACVPTAERGRGILISGSPKSNTILYTNGRSVIILNLDNPLDVSVYAEHAYPATVARFSPNGEWIASADVSGAVRIWGTRNEFVLKKEFKVLSGRIDDLQWSPDGMRIVACGEGKGKSFVRAFMDHSNFANCVRFSPDGSKFITVSSDKKGIIYDGKSAEKIGELSSEDGHKGSIYAVSWSPDGKQVLTVSADKSAKIWDISEDGNGKVKKTLTSPGSGGVEDMLVGCLWQNDHLVTVSLAGTISLFSATDLDKAPVLLSGHMKNVTSLVVLKNDPKVIVSCSYDGLIIKWIQGVGYSGRLQRKDNSQIKCLAAVEEEIVTSGFDNKIWRVPVHGDQCGDADSVDIGTQPKDLSLALLSPEIALVSTDSGVVILHGTKVVSTVNLGFTVTASAIAPDGMEAIIGGQDGKLHIYSITGDILKEEAVLEKHRGAVSVIRYSPDVSMFASGDLNREVVVWDRVSREVKLKNMLYHTARVNCLAWSPDSRMVATGSLDTCVIIYEVDKPASSRLTIKGAHLGGVYGLAFTDQYTVVSSGEDACVRVWRLTPQS
ncbi:hypothetical protein I3842_15G123900 [Carya illinoinensis]|uniref:66 kDa stress protein n=1 Tax=Carya illinoinensis TaxID=32201 RepID=A0A922AFM7_CARIL|nr:hypothetical protein I3842_15G123900 [Carya illinoinensis]